MQHEISIDRELQFMIKYSLTPEEYFLFKLLFLAQNEHEEYLTAFYSQGQYDHKLSDLLYALVEKEIINKSYVVPQEGTTGQGVPPSWSLQPHHPVLLRRIGRRCRKRIHTLPVPDQGSYCAVWKRIGYFSLCIYSDCH